MPNHPTLDARVQWRIDHGTIDQREPGYRRTAEAILDAGLATEVRRLISAGKEADVYLCAYNGSPLAVKAYRLYRTSHRGGRPIKADTMSWLAAHEFEMMRQAWKGGASVPTPARRVENLLSMRYLGGTRPARAASAGRASRSAIRILARGRDRGACTCLGWHRAFGSECIQYPRPRGPAIFH